VHCGVDSVIGQYQVSPGLGDLAVHENVTLVKGGFTTAAVSFDFFSLFKVNGLP